MASKIGDGVRWIAVGIVAVASGFVAGCFVGSAALGLPCERDDDCGLDGRCIDGFCGGPPATVTGTTTDATTESSSGPEPSTGEPLCEGTPSAQCEPAMPGVSDATCDLDCTFPACGDGLHNPNAPNDAFDPPQGTEECDDGVQGTAQDSADCDANCTVVACGDDHFNPLAEACDDGNDEDLDACTSACQEPALVERFDEGLWTVEPYDLSDYALTPWEDTTGTDVTGWLWANGSWNSGAIPFRAGMNEETYQYNYAGTTRLVSDAFVLPETVPDGFTLQLRFSHSLVVEQVCNQDPNRHGDGGVVHLRIDGVDTRVVPVGGYTTLEDACPGLIGGAQANPNPLRLEGDGTALTGPEQSGPVIVDLTDHLGETDVQVVFEFGIDCIHCIEDEFSSSVWEIDDVIVAAFPTE